ncbi:hypothetical protein G5V59_18620 [Nocardioides sp. W3-2-3]|uniref:hypothetical protein n=1 Tax=Nocardioides convexus TaxID=2712224 RepID=UPI0024181A24|nr:hypothetical protein [Nocardioides convexus]NHA01180.1 hypothetical protein [Nocardioides convexus]
MEVVCSTGLRGLLIARLCIGIPDVAHLGDEALELAAFDAHGAAEVDDAEPVTGNVAFDAAPSATQAGGQPRRG